MRDLDALNARLAAAYQDAVKGTRTELKQEATNALRLLESLGSDVAHLTERDAEELTSALLKGTLTRKSFEIKLRWRGLLLRAKAGNAALAASVNAQIKLIEGARKFGEAAARLLLAVL